VKITSPNGGEVLEVASTTKITWEAQGVGMTSIALYENDKWAAWIAKDVFVGDTGEFCGTRGICEYSWNPSSPTVTYGLGDKLNKPIFKIYITGTKANGTGYVEDKSDRPFRFKDTPVFEAPVLKVSPETQAIEKGEYLDFLKEELESALNRLPEAMLKLFIIAYEPVWAIGKNAQGASTPGDFLEKSIFIRKVISDLYNQKIATSVPILYGGSVDERNARSFLTEGRAQGLLVGRASLNPTGFTNMLIEANAL
jgi:hypothetical protein